MPKKLRRKRRIWRKLSLSGIMNNTTTKIKVKTIEQSQNLELKTNEQLYFIDKQRGPHSQQSGKKQLYIERALNPFPHIKSSIKPPKKGKEGPKK